jgi:hypothetical protein
MNDDPAYNVSPAKLYDGPDFEEYCISEARYLLASRDRTPCITCPLSNLCLPGFEEQVRRIQAGENPSLTEGCAFDPGSLTPARLLDGLTAEQKAFILAKVPGFSDMEEA